MKGIIRKQQRGSHHDLPVQLALVSLGIAVAAALAGELAGPMGLKWVLGLTLLPLSLLLLGGLVFFSIFKPGWMVLDTRPKHPADWILRAVLILFVALWALAIGYIVFYAEFPRL
jgi:hypothetical protein